ncbi:MULTISPECIES: mycothiol conjugate amidase Mca [unclassified Cryobacterium]|uniref:mycothiol conjugate amidase Mca n=1 Tax=unclassified Cryobacterium TaxID=2649013 RepID=UPI002AB4AD78|nr:MULTISPECIES: mycothiol conjugate amidase Mca [unclassified Cryobacterium]MDY7527002.1 mycothiol conjugate amidase Mca [Cryobacterium sp. 10C2]MDY7557200.1 mycothiol conjugate amidase Mca [Cryobacterium sp. 10C3]MEB0003953.1 mycothiol conjugate amidase Mca [Cryobacterium sp. RTC2.1]MEB0203555.1 mycothiol conjugate amidase Mca [Cryobacterium sp. 5I3]MEB0287653.1 mycothiol conjugate amidase Mca [Cryobacterium sp. 10S3]
MTLRLLAVHAHPDDESSKGAASYAYYRSRGAEVMVVSCTGGEGGSILNDALADTAMAERDMAGLRRREMRQAQKALGIEHRWLGYQDSGMNEDGSVPPNSFSTIDLEFSAEPLVRIIREFRPQVLITYDENGGYPHPDHIRCHEVSMAAYRAAADPTRYPGDGEPWQIDKLYYDRIFNLERIDALFLLLSVKEPESPLLEPLGEARDWMKNYPALATTHVPVGDFLDARDAALRAHASQVSPTSSFFFWPNDLIREAWPYEDFQLVESKVETVMPESDLFAGIRDEA